MSLLLALVTASVAAAQGRALTGRVLNPATQEGIPGAIVEVVGTTRAAQADDQGRYRLANVPEGELTLQVRSIGYKRGTVRVAAGATTADITLDRDPLRLDEVVVTGQATTTARANAATAVATVNAEELARVPAPALESAMQGKVIGARINMNSGAPGGGGQVQIRGVTTILGNGQPLYVVDGVIISNAQIASGTNTITGASGSAVSSSQDNATNRLADLNPNDIENIEILKGAAASAIYGSRATNGVVLITTKRGRTGAPRFDISTRVGTYDAIRLPGHRRFPDRDAAVSAARAAGVGASRAGVLVDSLIAANGGELPFYDFQEELYGENGLSYETQLALSGGTESTKYYASGTLKDDAGVMMNTGARRQTLRLSLDHQFNSRLNFSVGANASRTTADRGISNNDNSFTSPLYAFGYTPAIIDLNARDANGNFPENPFPGGGGNGASNPFQTMTYITNREDVYRVIANGRLNYTALAGERHTLSFSAIGGIDRFDQENNVYSPNFLQYEGRDGFFGRAVQGTGLSRQMNTSLNGVWEWTPGALPLKSTLSAGISQEQQDQNIYRVQALGLVPGIGNVNQGKITTNQTKERIIDQAYYVQEEILAFDDRLFLAAGFRADRSSANGENNRDTYYFFPKAQASYNFVNPLPNVERFKIRAAVGQSGNRPTYGEADILLSNNGRLGGIEGIGANGTLGNPDLKPERMTEYEGGFDAAFLDERVGVEATYFDRRITDLLLRAPLANSTGLTQQTFNGENSEMSSKGWELGLTLNPLRNFRGLDWVSRITYFRIRQQIEKLEVPMFLVGSTGFGTAFGRSRIAEGASTTAIWGNAPFVVVDGDTSYAPVGCYIDAECEANIAFRRDTIVGDATPDFEMTFGNDFTYKRLRLNVLLDWRKGGDVSNLTNVLFDEGETSRDYDAKSPIDTLTLGQYRYNAWNGGSDARIYVQDGSFVKLREVTISYELPQSLVQRALGGRARDARISLSGRNLAIWSDYWGSDPEVNNFGNQNVGRFVDLAPYPPSRSFFLAIDVGF